MHGLIAWFTRNGVAANLLMVSIVMAGMLALAPARLPSASPVDRPQVCKAQGDRRARVALLSGCAQQVLRPGINDSTIRLLARHGVDVVVSAGAACC